MELKFDDKELTLDELFEGLMEDKSYTLKSDLPGECRRFLEREQMYFCPSRNLYRLDDEERIYIGYSHYGSSATEFSKRQLKWVLETIFEREPKDFIELNDTNKLEALEKMNERLYQMDSQEAYEGVF